MTEAIQYKQQVPVQVHAGQTLIVDVKAKGAGTAAVAKGTLEVTLAYASETEPKIEKLFLVANQYSYDVEFRDDTGMWHADNVVAGTYNLTSEAPNEARTFRLEQVIQFESDSAKLPDNALGILQLVADFLAKPEQRDVTKLTVEGFTQDVGSEPKSKNLALTRAINVKEELEAMLKAAGVNTVYVTTSIAAPGSGNDGHE